MLIYLLLIALSIYFFIVIKRARRYKYRVSEDYIYDLKSNFISESKLDNFILQLPDNYKKYDTIIVEITLSFKFQSYLFKPYIRLGKTKYYFEYGASGVRYLNLSHSGTKKVHFDIYHTTLKNSSVKIYAYQNNIDLSNDNILILAPHADDAELAAFGLYKRAKNVTIITTTAGEHGLCNYCDLYKNDRLKSTLKKAELRAFDAISVPIHGDVSIDNSLALGYFGGTLKEMKTNPKHRVVSKVDGIANMQNFRKVSHASIRLKENTNPDYISFIEDLKEIVIQLKPDIIVTPHPSIDSHPDHKQTTLSIIEVLEELKYNAKLLLYTNHLELSEIYPIGTLHSSISLPPNKKYFYFEALFSFNLDKDLQNDKFFALESIHDLRDSLLHISLKKSLKHLNKMLKRKISGRDKSYYKRAIRSNELFFVVDSKNSNKLLT